MQRLRDKNFVWRIKFLGKGTTSSHNKDSLEYKNDSLSWCDLTKIAIDTDMIRRIEVSSRKLSI